MAAKKSTKKRSRPTRRNPVAPAARARRPQVEPSAKTYKRRGKHKKPEPDDREEP